MPALGNGGIGIEQSVTPVIMGTAAAGIPLLRNGLEGPRMKTSRAIPVRPLVINKAKGPPGAPQHTISARDYIQAELQNVADSYRQNSREKMGQWLLRVWDQVGESVQLSPKKWCVWEQFPNIQW